jgi:hypothetical protein
MEKKRSPGVTISGIVFIIWPIFYLVRIAMASLNLTNCLFFSFLPNISNPIFLLQKLLFILCGIGILRLAKWGRILVLCISSFGIVVWVAAIIVKSPLSLMNKLLHVIIYVFLCWFFTRPKIKEQFK